MKITAWNIGIVWEDGTEENIGDVPDWVASRVDEFLNELEEEYSDDKEDYRETDGTTAEEV